MGMVNNSCFLLSAVVINAVASSLNDKVSTAATQRAQHGIDFQKFTFWNHDIGVVDRHQAFADIGGGQKFFLIYPLASSNTLRLE